MNPPSTALQGAIPPPAPGQELRVGGGVARGQALTILVHGTPVAAHAGESIATALLAGGMRHLRDSPEGAPRGAFCFMGVCQECVVEIDGRAVLACQTPVREGLVISLRREPTAGA